MDVYKVIGTTLNHHICFVNNRLLLILSQNDHFNCNMSKSLPRINPFCQPGGDIQHNLIHFKTLWLVLFHPGFVSFIPIALYHTARIRIDISPISL